MARHLRVFAVARPSPGPFANVPAPGGGPRRVRLRPIEDVQGSRRGDHARRDLLGLRAADHRTADIVTGGIIQSVLKIPADGLIWALISAMQNIVACIVLFSIGWAFYRRLVSRPAAADLQYRRADHPRDDRWGRRHRAVRAGLPGRRLRRHPGCLRLECAGRAAGEPLVRDPGEHASTCCGGATSSWSPRSCATCRSASTSTSPRPSRTSISASSPRAASCPSSTSRTRTRRSGSRPSRTSAGRTCSTASPAPSAVAARRPARPTTPASRSTPRN